MRKDMGSDIQDRGEMKKIEKRPRRYDRREAMEEGP